MFPLSVIMCSGIPIKFPISMMMLMNYLFMQPMCLAGALVTESFSTLSLCLIPVWCSASGISTSTGTSFSPTYGVSAYSLLCEKY